MYDIDRFLINFITITDVKINFHNFANNTMLYLYIVLLLLFRLSRSHSKPPLSQIYTRRELIIRDIIYAHSSSPKFSYRSHSTHSDLHFLFFSRIPMTVPYSSRFLLPHDTHPNRLGPVCLILFTIDTTSVFPLSCPFLVLYFLGTPLVHLNILVFATLVLCSILLSTAQHSKLYNTISLVILL